MDPRRDIASERSDAARAAGARDLAFARIRRTRRWLIAAAAGMTAGLAALASALLPGKSLGANKTGASASRSTASGTTSSGTPALPAPANGAQLGLKGPSAAPTPAPTQAQPSPQPAPSGGGGGVVSGGS